MLAEIDLDAFTTDKNLANKGMNLTEVDQHRNEIRQKATESLGNKKAELTAHAKEAEEKYSPSVEQALNNIESEFVFDQSPSRKKVDLRSEIKTNATEKKHFQDSKGPQQQMQMSAKGMGGK